MMVIPWMGGKRSSGVGAVFFIRDGELSDPKLWEVLQHLDCGGGYTRLHMTKLHRTTCTHPNECLHYWRDLEKLFHCGNVSVVVLISYYGCVRC